MRCLSLITFLTILGETISSTTTQGKTPVYYTKELSDPFILHFDTYELDHRLLSVSMPLRCDSFGVQPLILTSYFPFPPKHFYNFVLFTDPAIDNYYKRFVR